MKSRIFIVGMGRSGTTLLQSLLGSMDNIFTFPESHVFLKANFGLSTLIQRTFGRGFFARQLAEEFVRKYLAFKSEIPSSYNKKRVLEAFVNCLDKNASRNGCDSWIEKTPSNIFCIEEIEDLIKNPIFFHVIRDGYHVLNSQFQVRKEHTGEWNKFDLKKLIHRWNKCMEVTDTYAGKPNHYIVSYERLVNNYAEVMEKIAGSLDLAFDKDKILENYKTTAKKIVKDSEQWKANNFNEIAFSGNLDFLTTLTDKQREYLESNLNMNLYSQLVTKSI
jgi:hypothetical protein